MSARPADLIGWVDVGAARFEAAVAALTDAELSQPSGLPGWDRRHVVAHVACNADALVNLMDWAATGVETPMYASGEQRAAEIEEWAGQPAGQLRGHLRATDDRLARAFGAFPDDRWQATVRTARGRLVPAAEVPWMRAREVWVHAVDLGNGATLADMPTAVVEALVRDAVTGFAARDGVPPLELTPTCAATR
jgi:maleylpyruvate isomerase